MQMPADGFDPTDTKPTIRRLYATQHKNRVYAAGLGRGRGGVVELILVDFVAHAEWKDIQVLCPEEIPFAVPSRVRLKGALRDHADGGVDETVRMASSMELPAPTCEFKQVAAPLTANLPSDFPGGVYRSC